MSTLYLAVDDVEGVFYDAFQAVDATDAWQQFYTKYPNHNEHMSLYLKVRRLDKKDVQTINPIAGSASRKRA